LSITTAPAAAARGACTRLTEPPAEKKAISTPLEIVGIGRFLHGDLFAAEVDFSARRALARQRHQFADRKVALGEDRQQGFADGAGGTDHGDLVTALLAHL
jgi:hypothetical protein